MLLSDPLLHVDSTYVTAEDRDFVATRLALEHTRLADPRHLVNRVIGPTEFEWDFEPIGPGFLDLAAPFLAEPSGAGALYCALLSEYGIRDAAQRNAVVILEYSHFATRINDYFNYHDAFAEAAPEPSIAERLVQLRYGAQWLNNYPRWLVVTNELGVSRGALIGIHRWGHQSFTSTGISRACFVDFAHRRFAGVTRENWLALAPGLLCELVISPAVMATVLAERNAAELAVVKRAFSHLAVALKARLERCSLLAGFGIPTEDAATVALPWSFPGVAVTDRAPEIDPAAVSGTRFPRVGATVSALANASGVASRESIAAARAIELEHAAAFRSTLERANVLPRAAVELSRSFYCDGAPSS